MTTPDPQALLALYDDTMRRHAHPAGMVTERLPHLSRYTTSSGSQRFIMWHGFDDRDAEHCVDAEMTAVRGHASVLMWKLYAHDRSHDALREALLARGFDENDPSTLMAAAVDTVRAALPVAAGGPLTARQLTTVRDLDAYQAIWDDIWPGAPNARYVNDYKSRIEQGDPGVVFFAGFTPTGEGVTSGYMFHHPGDPFALLCGGGTKVAWRQQHAYTLMLSVRAQAAATRGARYLAVEASAESRPILARLGFQPLSTLMFYEKHIAAPSATVS
ncbi:MAG: hypothetical protein JNL19_03960 [Burkholderiales bacterium]|nr:hypothetical protein [Burkholderiales bacterium]